MVYNHVRNFLLEKLFMELGERLGVIPKGMARDMLVMSALAATPSRVYAAAYRGGLHVTAAVVSRFHSPAVKSGSKPQFTSRLARPGAGGRSVEVSPRPGSIRNYGIRRIGGGPPLGVSAGSLGLGLMILAPVGQYFHQRERSSLDYHS